MLKRNLSFLGNSVNFDSRMVIQCLMWTSRKRGSDPLAYKDNGHISVCFNRGSWPTKHLLGSMTTVMADKNRWECAVKGISAATFTNPLTPKSKYLCAMILGLTLIYSYNVEALSVVRTVILLNYEISSNFCVWSNNPVLWKM